VPLLAFLGLNWPLVLAFLQEVSGKSRVFVSSMGTGPASDYIAGAFGQGHCWMRCISIAAAGGGHRGTFGKREGYEHGSDERSHLVWYNLMQLRPS